MITVNIAKDFTRFPSGRYIRHGDSSGEGFRVKFLEQPLSAGQVVKVEFDGTLGYGSSFLEEAFGGVVRALRMPAKYVLEHLQLESEDPTIPEEVEQYIKDAAERLK